MELLQRLPIPKRLAARVWLLTVPSALISFERRQHIPSLPIGQGRFLGFLLIAAGVAAVLRGRNTSLSDDEAAGVRRLQVRGPVAGGLLAVAGVGLLLRSLMLTAYALGLGFAFTRGTVDLEEPSLPGRNGGGETWDYEETQV